MSKKLLFLSIIIFTILFVPAFVAHAQYGIDIAAGQTAIKDYQKISVQTIVGNALGQVLSLVGILFFLLMLYGGVTWMTASGNSEKEKKALGIIVSATIGVIIVTSSYVLVDFVFDRLGPGAGGGTKQTVEPVTEGKPLSESCKSEDGVDMVSVCADIYGDQSSCSGVAKEICDWIEGGSSCQPIGTADELCGAQTKKIGCTSGVYGDICKWQ